MFLPDEIIIDYWSRHQGVMHVGSPRGIRITHKATGMISIADTERSQHRNKERALSVLENMYIHNYFMFAF